MQLQIVIASTYGLMLINKIERKKKGFEKKKEKEKEEKEFFLWRKAEGFTSYLYSKI